MAAERAAMAIFGRPAGGVSLRCSTSIARQPSVSARAT
jgi:hypothetical protein